MSDSLWPHGLQQATFLSFTFYQSLLKLTSIESVMPSNHLVLCCPLLLLPSIFPRITVFSSQPFASNGQSTGASASASVLAKNIQGWYPLGLTDFISLQSGESHESYPEPRFKASILQHSAFFMIQLSQPNKTTGKTIALTRWILSAK